MWKRHESEQSSVTTQTPTENTHSARTRPRESPQKSTGGSAGVGQSIVFKGELTGSENLSIDGQLEGKIILRQHVLTVGPAGKVKAEISAKVVIVLGEVTGSITATEKIDLREKSSVEGDIVAPRVAMSGGAHFRGSIDMRGSKKPVTQGPAKTREPAGSRPSTLVAPTT